MFAAALVARPATPARALLAARVTGSRALLDVRASSVYLGAAAWQIAGSGARGRAAETGLECKKLFAPIEKKPTSRGGAKARFWA